MQQDEREQSDQQHDWDNQMKAIPDRHNRYAM
jgi:hypothetical protein